MKTVVQFSKLRAPMLMLSVLLIAAGLVGTVIRGGFNLGIDFQAGLSMQVQIRPGRAEVTVPEIREALSNMESVQVQEVGDPELQQFTIRVRDDGSIGNFQAVVSTEITESLRTAFGDVVEQEVAYVGPRFSRDLASQTVFMTVLAMSLILVYIWFRFRFGYALSAIAALVHDVLFMLGVIGAFRLEISTATIAAVLTIIGYSLNDTIVIFDRIRENEVLLRESDFVTITNTSISQSLSRTLITSLTTLLAVTAILVFATGQIQLFALNLAVGVVVGTYSSIFIASPTLIAWQNATAARRKKRDLEKYHKGSVTKQAEAGPAGSGNAPAAPSVDVEAAKRRIAQQKNAKKKRKG